MKKLLLSFAALLLASLALSQEADDFGSYAEVTLIPRLELNPSIPADTESGIGFGNSSFYTLFEGSISEHLSWTVANHWLHVTDGTGPAAHGDFLAAQLLAVGKNSSNFCKAHINSPVFMYLTGCSSQ